MAELSRRSPMSGVSVLTVVWRRWLAVRFGWGTLAIRRQIVWSGLSSARWSPGAKKESRSTV